MPEISTIPVPLFSSLDPYHFTVDNRPIEGLIERIFIVNAQVDVHDDILTRCLGTTGSLPDRLNQSLNDDGTLKTTAVDASLHSIAEHIDGGGFVRMTDDERDKLTAIDSDATNISINVETISTTVLFPDDGGSTLNLKASPTVTWRQDVTGVYADTVLGLTNQVIHNYDITPVQVSGVNYKTTNVNTAYKTGTLRVYVNGLRLTTGTTIDGYYYTEGTPSSGTFSFNTVPSGVIRIDFDQPIA